MNPYRIYSKQEYGGDMIIIDKMFKTVIQYRDKSKKITLTHYHDDDYHNNDCHFSKIIIVLIADSVFNVKSLTSSSHRNNVKALSQKIEQIVTL